MSATPTEVTGPPARPMTRRKVQAEQTRRKLIAAAVQHFSVRNFDEVATSDITETAGVAQGLLFHYFGNKRGIYLEALREAAAQLDAAQTTSNEGPPGQRIRQMLRAHFAYLAEHDGPALRLVLGGGGGDPEAWEIFDLSRWRTIEWTCRQLRLDHSRPALRLMLRSCAGAIDEATTYWLKNDQSFPAEQIVEILVEMTVTALRGAARLDPDLQVHGAVKLLRTDGAPSARRTAHGGKPNPQTGPVKPDRRHGNVE